MQQQRKREEAEDESAERAGAQTADVSRRPSKTSERRRRTADRPQKMGKPRKQEKQQPLSQMSLMQQPTDRRRAARCDCWLAK